MPFVTKQNVTLWANWRRYRGSRCKGIQLYRTNSHKVSGPVRIKLKRLFQGNFFPPAVKCLPVRLCVWHIILDAELYTTCRRERVLAPTRFNVTFLPLRLCYENTRTCFSKDAENLTTYVYILWCSQIVCIRPYSLNTIIAFYSVNEWSNFAVSVWLMACHATMLPHFT